MTHTGERVYCPVPGCNRSHSDHANLRRHDRDFHEPERQAAQRREERERRRRQAEDQRFHTLREENERLKDILDIIQREK